MNELKIFSSDVIPVYTTDTGEKVVVGRELHEKLKIGKDYSTCFKDVCEYGFSEGKDFSPISGKTSEQGGRPRIEHILALDMAKHIAMIQRTPEGKAIRQKLIDLEKNIFEKPKLSATEMLKLQNQAIFELDDRVASVEDKLENQMTIDHSKQRTIQNLVNSRVYKRLEENVRIGLENNIQVRRSYYFQSIYRDLKNRFGVASYRDIKISQYNDAINYISNWIEPADLRRQVG